MAKWFESRPYETWDPIRFPIEHSKHDMSITYFDIECNHCGETVSHVRAKSYEYPSCLEVRAAGICLRCQIIQYMRFRMYPDGRMLLEKIGRWETWYTKPKRSILGFFRKVLFYLFS
jgi:hypothetical protein